MLATSDVSISSCPGSSSRMQGISDVFGAINSAVLVNPTATMPTATALHVPFLMSLFLASQRSGKGCGARVVDCQPLENAMLSPSSRGKAQSYPGVLTPTPHPLPQGLPHFGAETILGFPIWHKPPDFLRNALSIKIAFTEIARFAGASFAAPTLHQL